MNEKDKQIKQVYQEFEKSSGDSISRYPTNTDRIFVTKENFKKCEEKYKKLLRQYFILVLFKRSVRDTESFLNDFELINSYLEKFKKIFNDTKKVKQILTIDMPEASIVNAYYKVSDLSDIIDQLTLELKSFENHYYPKLKMTSYNMIKDKTKEEVEKMANVVNDYINTFATLDEAYDFVMYNSGTLITDCVSELCNEINKLDEGSIDVSYFIGEDVVVYISYTDWINLYSRLQYVFDRIDKKILKIETLAQKLSELEIRYLVVLIYNEKK